MPEAANTLIVVNPTVAFCPGGESPVPHGDLILGHIHAYIGEHEDDYLNIICATSENGSPFHANVSGNDFDWWFPTLDLEPRSPGEDGIRRFLDARRITHLDIVGLPLEIEVKDFAISGAKAGFSVTVLTSMCAPYTPTGGTQAIEVLQNAGVHIDGGY